MTSHEFEGFIRFGLVYRDGDPDVGGVADGLVRASRLFRSPTTTASRVERLALVADKDRGRTYMAIHDWFDGGYIQTCMSRHCFPLLAEVRIGPIPRRPVL